MSSWLNILGNIVEVNGNIIPVTRQANNIAEMETRQLDYSARVKLPLTARIRNILGFPDTPGSTTNKAYETPETDVLSSGIPLIEKGLGRVLSVSANNVDYMINGAGYSFWRDIESLDLHDIDWSDLDFIFDVPTIVSMEANTSGISWPAIDYGSITGNTLDIRYSGFAVYFHEIVRRIVEEQGYTASGDILSDPFYLQLALPASGKWEHSLRFIERNGFDKAISAQYNLSDVYTGTASITNKPGGLVPFAGSPVYIAQDGITVDMAFTYEVLSLTKNTAGGNIDVKAALRVNGAIQATQSILTQPGSYTFSVPAVALSPGDVVDIQIVSDFTVGTGPVMAYQLSLSAANFYTPEVSKVINLGDTLTAEIALPKMSQKDFLKAFMQKFAIIPEVNDSTKTVSFRFFNEIYDNIHVSKDWSEKLIKQPSTLSHIWFIEKQTRIGEYAQNNYGNYLPDPLNADSDLGQGSIFVEDTSLPSTYDLFTMPWAASESVIRFVTTPARMIAIPFYEDDGAGGFTQEYEPKQRICYVDFPDNIGFNYSDGTTTTPVFDPPIGRFIEPSNGSNLGFGNNLLAKYYEGLRKMLIKAERYTVAMKLGPADVANHDFLTPIYLRQLGGYFYVNKISNYIEKELTSVEIIKL